MAHIIIQGKTKRYLIEIDENEVDAFKLTPNRDKELIQIVRDNEREVIKALFLSDCESRTSKEIGEDLGIPELKVNHWKHDIVLGRKMTNKKFEALKKVYGVDVLLE